jgi:4-diphosphocytidyl-2-C-methyl-D-erythritol kinase
MKQGMPGRFFAFSVYRLPCTVYPLLPFLNFPLMPLTLPCPAKLNLFLEVRGKRADGFHELGTLFPALETGDALGAEPAEALGIAGAEGVTQKPEDNLILRAARALQARYPARMPSGKRGLRFTLTKRLPMGAGLGGGSSDAAAALRLANTLWELGLSDAELRAVGAELGSDVAFFLAAPTAFAEGRGEILSPAPTPPDFHVVVATPHCHVDTASAYRALGAALGGNYGTRWPDFRARFARDARDPALYRALHNDFEAPVMALFPEIRAVRDRLQEFAPVKAMMTGSGASVFALFEREEDADAALAAVAPECRFSVVTRFAS